MMRRMFVTVAVAFAAATLTAQQVARTRAPRIWTDEALKTWALPIAGVNASPNFYSEAEFYAAPVDELRTYPVYVKGREPKDYRRWMTKQGPKPLVEIGKNRTEAEWIAAGLEVFDGMDLAENRTTDPRSFAWIDDPKMSGGAPLPVTKEGIIVGPRWVVDHDGALKVTLDECSACHSRILSDGTLIRGAQGNLPLGSLLIGQFSFEHGAEVKKREGRALPPAESSYAAYGVPWLHDDVNARLKSMTEEEIGKVDGPPVTGTFVRVNASPWFTTKMADLIGVPERTYLDATATHRNRGPEDIARYGILVTDADDGSVGPHRLVPDRVRKLATRHSDDAMYALGKYIYSLKPPANPNRPGEETARGQQVFARSGCASCHTPPLYTNNKLVPVDGFKPFAHPNAPPASAVMNVKLGLDPGLALRTRKGTGYYKVPSLKGVWYRGPFEHSGSIATLEEWFDPARLRPDYAPKGWNPPDVITRAVPGHPFGLNLTAEDKRALIAFLRTL